MRSVQVLLAQNLGPNGGVGSILDVSEHLIEIGPWQRTCEKELTKVAPSEQTITMTDNDGANWSWISEHAPSSGDIWPLIVKVFIANTLAFTGFAPTRSVTRDEKTREITITASDWSYMLANKYLGAVNPEDDLNPTLNPWCRDWPRIVATSTPASRVCYLEGLSPAPGGYDAIYFSGTKFVDTGSMVTCNLSGISGSKAYKVRGVEACSQRWDFGSNGWVACVWKAQLDGFGADVYALPATSHLLGQSRSATFTTVALATSVVSEFTVTKTVAKDTKNIYALQLNTVDQIQPGDKLVSKSTTDAQTWEVLQVNAGTNEVITKEQVQDVTSGVTKVWWDEDSALTLVMTDAKEMITRAVTAGVAGYGVDFSRFTPTTLTTTVFQWIALRMFAASNLSPIIDIETTREDIKLFCPGANNWHGGLDTFWTATADNTKHADWSCQLFSAPASLMPYERSTLASSSRGRDKVSHASQKSDGSRGYDSGYDYPLQVLVYDYLQMRRLLIIKASKAAATTCTICNWGGTAWGSPTTYTWDSSIIWSACIVPGHPGKLAINMSSGVAIIVPETGVKTSRYTPGHVADDAELVCSPWGVYLVGGVGYGRIYYTAGSPGTITGTFVRLTALDNLYWQTLQQVSEDRVIVIGRFKGVQAGSSAATVETRLLTLTSTPTTGSGAMVSNEKLMDGAPATIGSVRDPSDSSRVVGHCGGRLWSVGNSYGQTYVLERFSPRGMKAMELIEFICQVVGAIAVPDPYGTLHIISRNNPTTGAALVVERVDSSTTYTWEHFYSLVRVSSAKEESILADAKGQSGGDILEISQHPMVWTLSGCIALSNQLAQFFGFPRRTREETWFHSNPNTSSPWENLLPLQTVRLAGDNTDWMILSISDDRFKGSAQVTLLEVFP